MALYHKHRPQDFASIVGQEHIVQTIKNQVQTNKVAHAYLFSGPRGVGKTTTARVLAKAVNCPGKKDSAEPDNESACAIEINNGRSIDVIEIDAASHTGVDNVRENIIDNAQFKPTSLKFKVFIIDEVHMLSTSAFNALLKTLEEPPAHAIFILATTEKHKLPATIISRCQVFDFKKVGYETMKKHIESVSKEEGVKVDSQVVDRIISKSDGCVRDAVSLLDQVMASGEKNITPETAAIVLPTTNVETTFKFVSGLISKDLETSLNLVEELVGDGTNLPAFAQSTIELLRLMLVNKGTTESAALGVDISENVKKELKNLSSDISPSDLVKLIDILIKRRAEIKTSPIPQLPLELAVVEWCSNNEQGTTSKEQLSNFTSAPSSVNMSSKVDKANPIDPVVEKQVDVTTNKEPTALVPQSEIISQKSKMQNNPVSQEPVFSLESAQNAWQECIKKIESVSPSLVFILKMANVVKIDENKVCTQVQYSFHRDKLTEKTSLDQIQKILSKILKSPVELKVEIAEKEDKVESGAELQELASAFGGEVV